VTGWAQMGMRERAFAALRALRAGKSIADAERCARYDANSDTVDFSGLPIGPAQVVWGLEYVVHQIRMVKDVGPLFSNDQAVLNALADPEYRECSLGCGRTPHPGRRCEPVLVEVQAGMGRVPVTRVSIPAMGRGCIGNQHCAAHGSGPTYPCCKCGAMFRRVNP